MDDKKSAAGREPQSDPTVFSSAMCAIEYRDRSRVPKHGRRLLKGRPVFAAIQQRLVRIPLKIVVHGIFSQSRLPLTIGPYGNRSRRLVQSLCRLRRERCRCGSSGPPRALSIRQRLVVCRARPAACGCARASIPAFCMGSSLAERRVESSEQVLPQLGDDEG